jgi:hypothetical protein
MKASFYVPQVYAYPGNGSLSVKMANILYAAYVKG